MERAEPILSASGNASPPSVDWEARYRAGDTPWDHGQAAAPLLEWLSERTLRGRVLVPGCGAGHDVRALSQHGAQVHGVDIAPSAIELARSFKPVDNETYEVADWLSVPDAWEQRFDWVVEHTCFCAIDPSRRHDYAQALHRVLRPGGGFLAVFYLEPDVDEGPPFGVSREELDDLFSGVAGLKLITEQIPRQFFASREGRECVRHYEKPANQ